MTSSNSKPSLRESLSGFPVWKMFVVSVIRLSEPIAFTSMFPYIYFMVRDFKIAKHESEISAYTGYLAAAFAFVQFFVCIPWSSLSDRIGRKPVLLCGLSGTALLMLIFGFSPNYYVALFARSLLGALNGNVAVIRTAIGEIAVERKHQALAFSLLSFLWNVGSVIGPWIGGSKYLTRPPKGDDVHGNNLNDYYNNFLNKYPYALSNIVVAACLTVSFLFALFFFEETNEKFTKRRDIGLEIGDWIRYKLCGYEIPNRYDDIVLTSEEATENDPLLKTSNPATNESAIEDNRSIDSYVGEEESGDLETTTVLTRRTSDAIISRSKSNISFTPDEISGFNSSTFTAPVLQTFALSFMLSFHQIVFLEYLPVLLAGEFMRDSLKFPFYMAGGFGWDSESIGTLLSLTGMVGVVVAAVVFPYMDRHVSSIVGFRISASIFPFVYSTLPFLVFSVKSYNENLPALLNPVLTYLVAGVCQMACSIAFPQSFILLHRATLPQHRGLVNGTILSLGSLARCVAPLSWGWLISYCNSIGMGELSWIFLSCICVIGTIQAFTMREYNEDMK